jgi:hypothetical protein
MTTIATSPVEQRHINAVGEVAGCNIISPTTIYDEPKYIVRRQRPIIFFGGGSYHDPSPTIISGLFSESQSAPTVDIFERPESNKGSDAVSKPRDEVLKTLRKLRIRSMLMLDSGVRTAVSSSIDDAIVVAQAWPGDLPVPSVEVDDDGRVSLEVLTDDGFAVSALDFLGVDNLAAYSIVDGNRIVASGMLNTTSTTEVIQFFQKLANVAA